MRNQYLSIKLNFYSVLTNQKIKTLSNYFFLSKCFNATVPSLWIEEKLKNKLKNIFLLNSSCYDNRKQHLLFSYQKTISELPPNILALLKEFKNNPKMPSALLIKNLPIDDSLPNTPFDGKRSWEKLSFVSETCLTGFGQILGEPYSYKVQKDGDLIHNVCPVMGQESTQSNEGSSKRLNFHTEYAYFNFRPTFLALYCLRSDHDKDATTDIIDADELLKGFSEEEIKLLRQPIFSCLSSESFKKIYGETFWSELRPIFSGSTSSPEILMNLPNMKTYSRDADYVLKKIIRNILKLNTFSYSIKLEPGDLLIINNRKSLHGRSFFTPRYDGKDRWLQRMYIAQDLWGGRSEEQENYDVILSRRSRAKIGHKEIIVKKEKELERKEKIFNLYIEKKNEEEIERLEKELTKLEEEISKLKLEQYQDQIEIPPK